MVQLADWQLLPVRLRVIFCYQKNPIFVHGVWGPYRDVLARGFWAAEGGQSCTGVLLDHLITTHPAFTELSHMANLAGVSKFEYLNKILETLVEKRKVRSVISLAKHLFFLW